MSNRIHHSYSAYEWHVSRTLTHNWRILTSIAHITHASYFANAFLRLVFTPENDIIRKFNVFDCFLFCWHFFFSMTSTKWCFLQYVPFLRIFNYTFSSINILMVFQLLGLMFQLKISILSSIIIIQHTTFHSLMNIL